MPNQRKARATGPGAAGFFRPPSGRTVAFPFVRCSCGCILAQNTIGQSEAGEMVAFLEGENRGYETQQARATGGDLFIAPPPVNMYREEFEAFSQALLDGRKTTESALAGLLNQMVLAACYKSAKTRREVAIGLGSCR